MHLRAVGYMNDDGLVTCRYNIVMCVECVAKVGFSRMMFNANVLRIVSLDGTPYPRNSSSLTQYMNAVALAGAHNNTISG